METCVVGFEVVICEAFPTALPALEGSLAVENSVFVQGQLSRVFLITITTFEWLFNSRLEVNFYKAVRSQVLPSQMLDLGCHCF